MSVFLAQHSVMAVQETPACELEAPTVALLHRMGSGEDEVELFFATKTPKALEKHRDAILQSRRARFTTVASLVNELVEARDDRSLSRVVARFARYDLLVLDEMAQVSLLAAEAELLFHWTREVTVRALIITNLPFGEWTKMFPEPRLCKAVVNRVTFNAHIVQTGTESWRFKKIMEKKQRKGGGPRSERCRKQPHQP